MLTIAQALTQGGKVTVEGVATTTTRFFDASGRLLVIQDATAAIQVRLPVAGTAAAPGWPATFRASARRSGSAARSVEPMALRG